MHHSVQAARLGAWSVRGDGGGRWSFEADAFDVSAHWMAREPLRLVLEIQRETLTWEVPRLQVDGEGRVTAVLNGPPGRG